MKKSEQPKNKSNEAEQAIEGNSGDQSTPVFHNRVIQKMIQRRKEITEELRSTFISPDAVDAPENQK